MEYPRARRSLTRVIKAGCSIADPYDWLTQDSTAADLWLEAQRELFWHWRSRQKDAGHWASRLQSRQVTPNPHIVAVGKPDVRTGMLRPMVGRKLLMSRDEGDPETLIDLDKLDHVSLQKTVATEERFEDGDGDGLVQCDGWMLSPHGKYCAVLLSHAGHEKATALRIYDLVNREFWQFQGVKDVAWEPDDDERLYTLETERIQQWLRRSRKWSNRVVFRTGHRVNNMHPLGNKKLLIETETRAELLQERVVWLGNKIIASVSATGDAQVTAIAPDGAIYVIDEGRLFMCDYDNLECILDLQGQVISEAVIGEKWIAVIAASYAKEKILIIDRNTGSVVNVVPFPSEAWHLSRLTINGDRIDFRGSSLANKTKAFAYDIKRQRLWPEPEPGGDGVVEQHTYLSHDGTPIPITLLLPKNAAPGPKPTLLYAYGGYGLSTELFYRRAMAEWVKAGGICAIAHVRGGGEGGRQWHAAAQGPLRHVALDDFAAGARWLQERGYTDSNRLGAWGQSSGGGLVSAVALQHPSLFRAVVSEVGVSDVTQAPRIYEHGSVEKREHVEAMIAGSPYHRVRPATKLPAFLLTCARNDPRVSKKQVFKLCAALQWATTSDLPVLLRYELGGGHFGPVDVQRQNNLTADILTFFSSHLGLKLSFGDIHLAA